MNKFINRAAMISNMDQISNQISNIIANMDDSSKEGMHWWSILDLEPKNDIFFFDFSIHSARRSKNS